MPKKARWNELILRMRLVQLLRFLKQRHTYAQLAEMFKEPATVLARYVGGSTLPSYEKTMALLPRVERVVKDIMVGMIKPSGNGFFDITRLLSEVASRTIFTVWAVEHVIGTRVNKVLTAAVDGVPLAVSLSDALGVPLAVAKKEREAGVAKFWTAVIEWPSGRVETLWLPRHLLCKRDWVVIVDDIIRTGETLRALIRLVQYAGAKVAAALAFVGVKPYWRRAVEDLDAPVDVFMEVTAPTYPFWR